MLNLKRISQVLTLSSLSPDLLGIEYSNNSDMEFYSFKWDKPQGLGMHLEVLSFEEDVACFSVFIKQKMVFNGVGKLKDCLLDMEAAEKELDQNEGK